MDLSGILGHVFAVFSFFWNGSATNPCFASATTAKQIRLSNQHCFRFRNHGSATTIQFASATKACNYRSATKTALYLIPLFKPSPQSPTCNASPHITALPFEEFLSGFKLIFLTSPQSPTCNSSPQLQPCLSKRFCHDSRLFFKPPPQSPTCNSSPHFTFLNSPSPQPYIQGHSSIIIFVLLRVLMAIPSHLNLPKALHALVVAEHGV